MKALLLILFPILSFAQCDETRIGSSYNTFPSFFGLYFAGDCVSRNMTDTVICVKFPPSNLARAAYFSFSTPNGSPVNVTNVESYTRDCEFIGEGNEIYPSLTDTTIVCYTIQSNFIDNFCPYAMFLSPLAVQFCGVYANVLYNRILVDFRTCSNSNTNRYEVMLSRDLENWLVVKEVKPVSTYSNELTGYKVMLNYFQPGISYIMIREVDNNGNAMMSKVVNVFQDSVSNPDCFDILGRKVNPENEWKQWHWIRRN